MANPSKKMKLNEETEVKVSIEFDLPFDIEEENH